VVRATAQSSGALGFLCGSLSCIERAFPVDDVRFFASSRSVGRRLPWADGEVDVEDAATPTSPASTWP
jgi:aspartate-semialdehyde dehydrogenase